MLWLQLRRLRSANRQVVEKAIQHFGASGDARAIPALVEVAAAGGEFDFNRKLALEALERIDADWPTSEGARRAVSVVCQTALSGTDTRQRDAIRILVRIGGEEAERVLTVLLRGHDDSARRTVADALFELPWPGADKLLQRYLPRSALQSAAVHLLVAARRAGVPSGYRLKELALYGRLDAAHQRELAEAIKTFGHCLTEAHLRALRDLADTTREEFVIDQPGDDPYEFSERAGRPDFVAAEGHSETRVVRFDDVRQAALDEQDRRRRR